MSEASIKPITAHAEPGHGHDDHGHGHNPHLAHHFDTMEQQYDSGKLGMWVFLATELLMFGGLFCAYSVYRANHPEVFLYAHHHLNTNLGAVNTAILLASSLSMAWAVRCSQINKTMGLVICLILTLLGGGGFMVIKAIEYNHKFHDGIGPGYMSKYSTGFEGDIGRNNPIGVKNFEEEKKELAPKPAEPSGIATTAAKPFQYLDPNAGGTDAAKITPRFTDDTGLASSQRTRITEPGAHDSAKAAHGEHGQLEFIDLDSALSRQRVGTFFAIYYCMTGLHGLHVLVGMALIFWILYRAGTPSHKRWIPPLLPIGIGAYFVFLWYIDLALPTPNGHPIHAAHTCLLIGCILAGLGALWLVANLARGRATDGNGEFSEAYYAPVDLVGLYWHLVDLIWIFLFPLLYLIHGSVGS